MGKSPREPRWGVSRQGWPASASPPPTAEQQHLEEGQKFKQQVQNERADNQQRAAEAAKHKRKPGRPRKDAFEGSDAEGSEEEGSDAEGGNEERDGEEDGDDT